MCDLSPYCQAMGKGAAYRTFVIQLEFVMSQSDKQYAVIGLGRFGMSICEELSAQGAEVLAIDINEELVQKASDVATQAIVADCINEETLSELHLQDYDLVVVAIGEKVKNSIMATLLLKESGVKKVWVKANDRFHARILQKVGADKIILPERDMGVRIARSIMDIRVFDFLELGSEQAITEFVIGNKNMGHKLQELPIFNVQAFSYWP